FLLTGGINYYRVIVEKTHKGDPLYHALLGTKILLAMGIFFIASALVGRAAAFEGMRRDTPKWLLVNLLLAAVIVATSGFLKVRGEARQSGPQGCLPDTWWKTGRPCQISSPRVQEMATAPVEPGKTRLHRAKNDQCLSPYPFDPHRSGLSRCLMTFQ